MKLLLTKLLSAFHAIVLRVSRRRRINRVKKAEKKIDLLCGDISTSRITGMTDVAFEIRMAMITIDRKIEQWQRAYD